MSQRKSRAGLSFERILFYASSRGGLVDSEDHDPGTLRRLKALEADGEVELRVRTVDVPEDTRMPESCKAVAMFDTWSARTVTVRTWHAVKKP